MIKASVGCRFFEIGRRNTGKREGGEKKNSEESQTRTQIQKRRFFRIFFLGGGEE
jgi:hypothetical protein